MCKDINNEEPYEFADDIIEKAKARAFDCLINGLKERVKAIETKEVEGVADEQVVLSRIIAEGEAVVPCIIMNALMEEGSAKQITAALAFDTLVKDN